MFQIEDLCNEEANKAYEEFYATMKDYLTSKLLIIANKYETIDFPFHCIQRLDIQVKMEMTIDQFKGYMASCHFWPPYSQANPTTSILEDFMIRIQRIFGNGTTSSAEVNIKVYRKIFLVLGRNHR
ncbi:uncharacterized protein LOC129928019 [Biomphalaria glabrata]|uniref:Uncharacterized protein LOC129928019 n=1 Tax=Biomphalaria glabrata TaxID=6526 RepID=A0A9W3B8Q6_BIOGL|nr:uncharacterized protein LOC129928019 [Biomphalaria glabrata]